MSRTPCTEDSEDPEARRQPARSTVGDSAIDSDRAPGWGRVALSLAGLLRAIVPGPTAESVLRDIDDGYQNRQQAGQSRRAGRWLLRQLLLTLHPQRLLALRAMRGGDAPRAGLPGEAGETGVVGRAARMLAGFATDLRYSARLLAANPGFTALTVAVLAGGLGVSIFTYSLLHTLMYKALPIPDGELVVAVYARANGRQVSFDAADFAAIRGRLRSFEDLGTYTTRQVLVRGSTDSRALRATSVEPSAFDFVGVPPAIGRVLVAEDALPGAEPVAVLGHYLWLTAFGADPAIVGRLAEINGVATRLVGVMPEGFSFPVFDHLWVPLDPTDLERVARGESWLGVYARLRPGVSTTQANAELHTAVQSLRAETPDLEVREAMPQMAVVRTFQLGQMGDEGPLMFGMLHLVSACILLLACFNAGNLLLSRALERSREISIRVAIGAPRLRLITQMMGESVLLTTLSGVLALLLAGQALEFFNATAHAALPEGLAYWWVWGLDRPTVLAALGFVAGAIVVVGGVPAWRVTRSDTNAALRDGGQGTQGREIDRLSRAMVVAQVAIISILLFVGSMTGALSYRAGHIDFGIDTERVLAATVVLPDETYPSAESHASFFRQLRTTLAASAEIETVVLDSRPPEASRGASHFLVDGALYDSIEQQPAAYVRTTEGEVPMIGVKLRVGRVFDTRDGAAGLPAALVSESLARQIWTDASPLGQRIRIGELGNELPSTTVGSPEPWRTVVGVVSDIVEGSPLARVRDARTLYLPFAQAPAPRVQISFRHRGNKRAAVTALQTAIMATDPAAFPNDVRDMEELLGMIQGMSAAMSEAVAGCFAFALLLAVGGIYGLTSRSVTLRTHEIGIRRALGATNGRIIGLFLRGGGRQLAIGLGIAAVVAVGLSVAVAQLMPPEAGLYVAAAILVPALISVLVLTATYVPTRRAVRLAPRAAIWREAL